MQIIAEKTTGKVLAIFIGKGKTHDFQLFKNSKVRIAAHIIIVADSGYQGIDKIHKNSITPNKKPKNGELTEEEKQENKHISRFRIGIEHINRRIKRFRILSTRYRNRRRRFGLRASVICGIHNFELLNCA